MSKIAISKHLKDNYENYYENGISEWRRLGALGKADNILALCKNIHHDTILEIGAGEGAILERLSEVEFGKCFYALEISPSGVEAIVKRKINKLIECRLFDGYSIPYDSDTFDIAILSHVIEHVEHPRQLIYEASRVARVLFIEVPLEDTIRLTNDFIFDYVGHINTFSMKTFRRLLQSCNLKVLDEVITNPIKETYSFQKGTHGLINYYIKQLLLKISHPLATNMFTYHGACLCEKIIC